MSSWIRNHPDTFDSLRVPDSTIPTNLINPQGTPSTVIRTTIPVGTTPLVVLRSMNTPATTTLGTTNNSLKVTSVVSGALRVASPGTVIRPIVQPAVAPTTTTSSTKSFAVNPVSVKPPSTSSDLSSVKPESTSGLPLSSSQRNVIREMQVRVPNRRDRRFSVLRFHASDHPDLASGVELFLQRENNFKLYRSLHNISDAPERGAGTEYGREAKEEARLRKYGVIQESYRPDDQPWIMTVGKGKTGRRRFKGAREGNVSENVEYFVFCQCKDGNFDAYPVSAWFKMKPEISYRFLREEEAEVEYNRLNKTMNLFNVMIKRKLTDGGDEEAENHTVNRELGKELRYLSVATDNRTNAEKESSTSGTRGIADSKNTRGSDRSLKLTDFEEVESNSEADDEDDDAADEPNDQDPNRPSSSKRSTSTIPSSATKSRPKFGPKSVAEKARHQRKKQRDARIVSRMRRCGKKRRVRKGPTTRSSDEDDDPLDEARDDSEVDDHEGDEVDYMTNSSSDEEKLSLEDRERIYEETGVDEETALKALLTDISSDDEQAEGRDESGMATNFDDDPQEDSNQSGFDASRRHRETETQNPERGTKSFENLTGLLLGNRPVREEAEPRSRREHIGRTEEDRLSSSSSSSSADGDTSVYSSSSSSDSELETSEKAKKNVKKAVVFQKLSQSLGTSNSVVSSGASEPGDPSPSSGVLKRPSSDTTDLAYGLQASASKKTKLDSQSTAAVTASATGPAITTCDSELMNTVRKYLMRKPITVTELLKKIRLRKLVTKNEDAQTALANVLRQLRPIKQIINGQHALSLK